MIGEKPTCNKFVIAATTIALLLFMVIPNHSLLAFTEHKGGDKPSSSMMFFKVLNGDLNVCSPNYTYNITICQMVMKDEELLPYTEETTNGIYPNNATHIINSTNSSRYPPLSVNPEMVFNEEQLQALLTNSSLDTLGGVKHIEHNDTGGDISNATQSKDVGKRYVDGYPEYAPLVVEQPLEEETTIDNTLQKPLQTDQQPLVMNNQTASNGIHDIEGSQLLNDPIRQEDNQQDSSLAKGSSNLEDSINNPKADTSNSYSSIPIGMSLPPLH